ncbi:hypothetical protein EHS39_33625, partial [Ensifer sp. MPMI2T]
MKGRKNSPPQPLPTRGGGSFAASSLVAQTVSTRGDVGLGESDAARKPLPLVGRGRGGETGGGSFN